MEAIEQFTQQALRRKSRSTEGIITIPVVFHIIHNDSASNVSREQILSQLNVINEDFRNRNENRGDTPAVFKDREADVEIEFCLANVDPNGYKTTGITRTETYHPSFWINAVGFDLMKFDATGGRDAWPADQYLNIWVCKAVEGGLLGYAQFPGGPPETDGIVVDYRFFGTVGEVPFSPAFTGRTATHEIGHWLGGILVMKGKGIFQICFKIIWITVMMNVILYLQKAKKLECVPYLNLGDQEKAYCIQKAVPLA